MPFDMNMEPRDARQALEASIHEVMRRLAEKHTNFELSEKGVYNRDLERRFQEAFCDELNALSKEKKNGWCWRREAVFASSRLTNSHSKSVDILGAHEERGLTVIELKYVTEKWKNGRYGAPSDPPAFAYDVIKDCLKGELLLTGLVPVGARAPLQGGGKLDLSSEAARKMFCAFSIGLTNHDKYWLAGQRADFGGWARRYMAALRQESQPFTLPKRIETVGQTPKKLDNRIFRNSRCHLTLALSWSGQWHDWGGPQANGVSPFRYVLLQPSGPGSDGNPGYGHDGTDPRYLPFLNLEARDAYLSER